MTYHELKGLGMKDDAARLIADDNASLFPDYVIFYICLISLIYFIVSEIDAL